MFRGSSAHLQEVNDVNCTYMQPLVFSFSAGGRLVHLLRGDLCIKLVSIKELYYDARPNKSQDLHCKTSKTDIPLQEYQNKTVQKQCGHLVQQAVSP